VSKHQNKRNSLNRALDICLKKNLIFAAYRLPKHSEFNLTIQRSQNLHTLSENTNYFDQKGFLVAPFTVKTSCPPFLIQPDFFFNTSISSKDIEELESLDNLPPGKDDSEEFEEISKAIYMERIQQIIDKIQQGKLEKVVPSRIKTVNGNFSGKLSAIFNRLCSVYPNAFVYMFNTGKQLWAGATPEPLLIADNGTMHTASIAGTKLYNQENKNIGEWNSKERLEQEYVTRFISCVLSKFNIDNIKLEGPYTEQAGNLIHLKTHFSFHSKKVAGQLGNFLEELHPTPAVCGIPRKESFQLLERLEPHNREYYAGYLGPMGLGESLSLFVNLRCMKVLQNKLALYVGGGITADSVPEAEWNETEIKSETLLSVLTQ